MIVGIIGFIGSGKDTAADYLVNHHDFVRESFASNLKDSVAAIFGWDRTLLEGLTEEARIWREQVDTWWASRLNMPTLTPRWVLQHWGTEVCRQGFHDDIWIASLENRLKNTNQNIVISDCRFPNELTSIKNSGGILIRVCRGDDPEWYDLALNSKELMPIVYPDVHTSEWAWIGTDFDYVVENNGSKQDLFSQLNSIIKNPELDPLDAKVNVAYEVAVGNWHRLT
jgi:hypothetical protein